LRTDPEDKAMNEYIALSSVIAYPLLAGLLFVIAWFVADELWYLDDHK
jgi:hypothetical protein